MAQFQPPIKLEGLGLGVKCCDITAFQICTSHTSVISRQFRLNVRQLKTNQSAVASGMKGIKFDPSNIECFSMKVSELSAKLQKLSFFK